MLDMKITRGKKLKNQLKQKAEPVKPLMPIQIKTFNFSKNELNSRIYISHALFKKIELGLCQKMAGAS